MTPSLIVVRALLLGDVRDLDPGTFYLLSRLGLGHMLSVSGFHMAIAVGLGSASFWLLSKLWQPKSIRQLIGSQVLYFAITLVWMLLLAAASGWAKPAVRSLAFVAVGLAARASGLSLSRLFVVLVSLLVAWILGQGSILSFLLSAIAVGGFLLATPKNIFSLLLWPWLATNVLVVLLFHQLSLMAPLANILFAPIMNIAIVLPAFLAHLFGFEWAFLTIAQTSWDFLEPLLGWLGSFSYAALWVPQTKCLVTFVILASAWFCGSRLEKRWQFTFTILAVLASFFLPERNIEARILNVEQGDSILLRNFLVDTGPTSRSGPYPSLASSAIENQGLDALAGILITHPDWDHYGGLRTVLARHPVETLYLSRESLRFAKTYDIIESAERAQIPIKILNGETSPIDDLTCKTAPPFLRSTNDQSILCRYSFTDGRALLLTGDMSEKAESYWTSDPGFLRADFLKVAHHGSRFSSSSEFLEVVQPKFALISSGPHNRYGHPHREVLERLEGIKILRTDREGEIALP